MGIHSVQFHHIQPRSCRSAASGSVGRPECSPSLFDDREGLRCAADREGSLGGSYLYNGGAHYAWPKVSLLCAHSCMPSAKQRGAAPPPVCSRCTAHALPPPFGRHQTAQNCCN